MVSLSSRVNIANFTTLQIYVYFAQPRRYRQLTVTCTLPRSEKDAESTGCRIHWMHPGGVQIVAYNALANNVGGDQKRRANVIFEGPTQSYMVGVYNGWSVPVERDSKDNVLIS